MTAVSGVPQSSFPGRMTRWCLFFFFLPLLCDAAEFPSCYTFYAAADFDAGDSCGDVCPYRTTCSSDASRSTCVKSKDCEHLLPRGQGVELSNYSACISCDLEGCLRCGINTTRNNSVICTECAIQAGYSLDEEKGTCNWDDKNAYAWFFWGLAGFCGLIVFLLLATFFWAEILPNTNKQALRRGRQIRYRSLLFQSRVTEDAKGKTLERYKLRTNIHNKASGKLAGPGHTLYMNWFPFLSVMAFYLAAGVYLFGPSSSEEKELLDPCLLQDGTDEFNRLREREGDLEWALWNYCGSVALSFCFLIYQARLWSEMVADPSRPSLKSFCVEFRGFPPAETDKSRIEKRIGDWMTELMLDRSGIMNISIAYDIPAERQDAVDIILDQHLRKCTKEHFIKKSTSQMLDIDGGISRGTATGHLSSLVDAGPIIIQILAAVLHKTPIHCCRRRLIVTDVDEELENHRAEGAREFLNDLQGSGTVFVSFATEALASAVASMGSASLEGLESPVKLATVDPMGVRWRDYTKFTILEKCYKIVWAIVVLAVVFVLWMNFFFMYLSFEVLWQGDSSYGKEFLGTFIIGLLVPIGNAIFGAVIDMATDNIGFKDQETIRVVRLILNVFINGLANFGEVVLIYKQLYSPNFEWSQLVDTVMKEVGEVKGLFNPFGARPNLKDFHDKLQAILFPAGLLVPLLTIPLLENVFPFWVGRLRLKRDTRLTEVDAERMLKAESIDQVGPFSDMVINSVLVAYCYWLSPGSYLLILWIAVALWALAHGLVLSRMYLLRWQARSWFGGKDLHACMAMLLSLPLGFFASALYVEWRRPHGHAIEGFVFSISLHCCFVYYFLPSCEGIPKSKGKHLREVVEQEKAPLPTYLNTNPIEVLKDHFFRGPGDAVKLKFFCNDKWYLHLDTSENLLFKDEDLRGADSGLYSDMKREAFGFMSDLRDELPRPMGEIGTAVGAAVGAGVAVVAAGAQVAADGAKRIGLPAPIAAEEPLKAPDIELDPVLLVRGTTTPEVGTARSASDPHPAPLTPEGMRSAMSPSGRSLKGEDLDVVSLHGGRGPESEAGTSAGPVLVHSHSGSRLPSPMPKAGPATMLPAVVAEESQSSISEESC